MSLLPDRSRSPRWRYPYATLAGSAAAGRLALPRSQRPQRHRRAPDLWALLRPFLGTSSGSPGHGKVRGEYRLVLWDRFIGVRNTSTYLPHEKNPKGEAKEDVGYVGRDRTRKVFVLRQFHVEGFVNTYPSTDGSELPRADSCSARRPSRTSLTAGALATRPPVGADELVEVFGLAEPGQEFTR